MAYAMAYNGENEAILSRSGRSRLEDNIRISKRPCNILFIIYIEIHERHGNFIFIYEDIKNINISKNKIISNRLDVIQRRQAYAQHMPSSSASPSRDPKREHRCQDVATLLAILKYSGGSHQLFEGKHKNRHIKS